MRNAECGKYESQTLNQPFFPIPHSQFRIQILVPIAGIDSQTHIFQHLPGTLTILLIIGFTGFYDGLNYLVTDPAFF
jgi:hypothetical protein